MPTHDPLTQPEQHAPDPTRSGAPRTYTIHTNADRTILLNTWANGTITIAFRDTKISTWGPPITLHITA